MKPLNKEEKITNFETMRHIRLVSHFINIVIKSLLDRAEDHDQTKLGRPEVDIFTEYTPKLAATTYGSDEYKGYLEEMKVALDHHYAKNRHHPEYAKSAEIWKDVVDYEDYYKISNLGRVKNNSGAVLSTHVTPKGYERIQLQANNKHKNMFIHTLVARAFIGERPSNRHQVNHKNGIKLDNAAYNLEYTTPSKNLQHAYKSGLRKAKVKYVVHCKELDITTFGIDKMAQQLRKLGYTKVRSSGIYRCIASEGNSSHLDLHFESYNINDYKENNSYVNQMNLVDIVEMFCDWVASSMRHHDGNLLKSIELNSERFGITKQLAKILENTAQLFEPKTT